MNILNKIWNEDCIKTMQRMTNGSVNLIATSPPYNIGKEYEKSQSIDFYIGWIKSLLPEFYRVLADDGSICFQVGNYVKNGAVYPIDCLLFNSFLSVGFIPRNRIIWHFGHGLHCKKRFSGRHETILWFTKSNNYKFNLDPIRVPSKYPNKKHYKGDKKGELSGNPLGKNPSDVWDITNVKNNHPEKTDHPCQFPERLIERLVLSLTNKHDVVYDPFMGSGTTGKVSHLQNRNYIGSEISAEYVDIANQRIQENRIRLESLAQLNQKSA